MKTLEYLLSHNSLFHTGLALGLAATTLLLLVLTRNFIARRLGAFAVRTTAIWDDVLAELVASTKWSFMASISILVGCTLIDLPASITGLPYKAMIVLLILQTGMWISHGLQAVTTKRIEASRKMEDGSSNPHFSVLVFAGRFIVWIIVLLLLLDYFGVNITTLVASLGIGGIAIALALQNILGDLFASLSIAIDKPFLVGDFIIVDDFMGTVKDVGLKTTRLQSLSGEELIFANNDLLKSRIRNYKRMAERRVLFGFGISYDTQADQLQALAQQVRVIIEGQEGVRFDRAHFKGFSPSSLDYEVVYFMLEPDFNHFMDVQQRINLALISFCKASGISFAYPTQTVHIASMAAPLQPAE
ncbi:MAG TPA: mechanosensitive ion channel family protein [Rhodocyclaceae bacterium]|nr:mechanosensitive ion channel family protein [Rhodocyclaceae bacterium]